MKDIVFKEESYAIVGACFEVYNEKGCGFLEPVYQECLVDEHRAQLLNYLHATGFQLGLLVNFGHSPRLEYERMARTEHKKSNDDVSF